MKKIETKEEIEKKNKRNQLVIGVILVGLMILSTGGYAIMNNESEKSVSVINHKGIKFYNNGGYWRFIYNNNQFSTQYNPIETENISIKMNINLLKYSDSVIYYSANIGQPINEIFTNIRPFILKTNPACINKLNCTGDFPIKTCLQDKVIIIREPLENETEEIVQDQNCVFIKAKYENQTKFADAFLFKLLEI